jgi:calcium permeable stress-gated cation channel
MFYLLFMFGIFTLRQSWILSVLLGPLIVGTVVWAWQVEKKFRPLSKYVSLGSVSEVERGTDIAEVMRLREGHPVTWSQRLDVARVADGTKASLIFSY